ncbi:unnamed protein product, partial [Porites evermanni]
LNILLSITASLGNTLILIALRKVISLHSPTKLLFQCLAITDLGVVSVLTTTALSVDRLLALLLKLRYRHVVTLKRASPIAGIFMFLVWDTNIALAALSVSIMLCIVTLLLSYTIIFINLRLHQATVHPTVQCNVHHGQPIGGGIPALNIAQFKRTVTSIALVHVLANSEVFGLASNLVFSTLVFLNSSLNPFLYCWRIKEVRQAVKATIKQLYCNCLR